MTRKEAGKRAAELSALLREYQRAYYVESRPLVPDSTFDILFDELMAIERDYPDLALSDSPTRRVGSDLTQELPETAHSIPVLSLDKSYTAEELAAWIAKTARNADQELSFVCEQKIDGASMVLYYEDGTLARAVTRGNGLVGNDVTGNVKTIGAVPLRLARPVTVAVRGEIFLARSLFDSINARMEEPYANPRNLASGTLRRVKSSEVADVPLSIYVYEGFSRNSPIHTTRYWNAWKTWVSDSTRVSVSSQTGNRFPRSRAGTPPGGREPSWISPRSSKLNVELATAWITKLTASWRKWTRSLFANGSATPGIIPAGQSPSSSSPRRGLPPSRQ